MNRQIIVGVMGSGEGALIEDCDTALELGKLIAQSGWILLSGGRNRGIMDAVSKGAKSAGGLTIGIIPYADSQQASTWVDIPIVTNMGSARNNINALSSDVVVACGKISSGTLSEIALAIKAKKPVILLNSSPSAKSFLHEIGGELISIESSAKQTVERIAALLDTR
jgi:hypothetical protein